MKKHRFEFVLAGVLAALFIAVWLWQAPGSAGRLTPAEVEGYLRQIDARAPMPPEEKAEFLARMRAWGEADDAQPVYMLNVMRYYEQLRKLPGAQAIAGTPVAANAHYERSVAPLLWKLGVSIPYSGDAMGIGSRKATSNLLGYDRVVDGWDRVLLVRYPSRRAFFRLITDPEYLKVMPYKLSALEVALVPTSPQLVVPDLRWAAAALCMIVFLAAGWVRAARRSGTTASSDRIYPRAARAAMAVAQDAAGTARKSGAE